jgi:DNA-directed RNA polymerase specialized sigma24 family protein
MSQAMPTAPQPSTKDPLGDPALRRSLEDFVRRRVPSSDVDDVVQTVLCDALAAPSASRPTDPTELRRWLLGIARHKVVDLHRRAHREPPAELPDIEAGPPPIEERGLARWAEEQAGSEHDAQKTLAWMAREGEGEKLEAIAAEEKVPAARVRQRVSRMRRWMKERWAAELAAVAMLTVLALAAWWLFREERQGPDAPPTIAPEPPTPLDRARTLRADALKACDRGEWRPCLDGLDQARGLDPDGEQAPAVGAARTRAEDALRSAPPISTAQPIPAPTAPSTAGPKDEGVKKPSPVKGFDGKDGKSSPFDEPSDAPLQKLAPPTGKPSGGTLGTPGGSGTGSGAKTKGSASKAMKKVLESDRY